MRTLVYIICEILSMFFPVCFNENLFEDAGAFVGIDLVRRKTRVHDANAGYAGDAFSPGD